MAANSVNKTPDSVSDSEKTPSPPHSPPPPPSDLLDKPIDLKGDTSPPRGWEQRLDLSLGEVYYVNKRTGERSASAKADAESSFAENCRAGDGGGGVKGGSSESSTTTTAASSAGEAKPSTPPMGYLVAAGCLACRRYFMVAKGTEDCPMCSGVMKAFDTEG